MSFGKMNTFAEITEIRNVKDSEGFSSKRETVLAFIRVYREGRHGSERWANLAAFSEATDLFRFRTIPDLKIFATRNDSTSSLSRTSRVVACTQRSLRKRWWRPVAKVDIKMPDDFLEKLAHLASDEDGMAERVLNAGAEVVEARVRSNLAGVIGRGTKVESRSTGQLLSALGTSSMKLDREGNHNVKVGFAEPRRDGDSNAKIANILEYGRHGQPAKPFLKPAKSASKSAAIEAMKRKLEEEVQSK